MEYLMHIGVLLCIYIILVISANLTVGMANMLTMCQAAFYGIGAYVTALILPQFSFPFSFVCVALIVMLTTGLSSLVISVASVKLKGDYFVLATLGFQMIISSIFKNWTGVTRGNFGISIFNNMPEWGLFLTALSFTVLSVLFFYCLQRMPYGRTLRAIRTDELSVKALGRNTTRLKAWAFFISAAFSGLAGLLYAHFARYIDPTGFTMDESIFILTALFLGGIGGRVRGPIMGAALVVVLPEILRFPSYPDYVAANLRQILYGLALIVLLFYRPQGLLGDSKLK